MNEWRKQYDPTAAKERLRLETRRPYVGWVDVSQHYYAKVYDPYRPRVLDHRQAETMPWLLEAVLLMFIVFVIIAFFVWASLAPRG